MVNLYFGHTAPVNPKGATPVLTEAQVWKALQLKIREPAQFVPAIATSEVVSDGGESGEVVRDVTFKGAPASAPKVRETVRSYGPLKVDFHATDGGLVSNIISYGGDGSARAEDLFLTYTFQWLDRPGEEGSPEAAKLLADSKANAKGAVEHSIETARQLVIDGKI